MKKSVLTICVVGLLVALSSLTSEAQAFFIDSPFTASYVEVIPNFDGFGNNGVIMYNSTDSFGSYFGVLLDPSGFPVASSATFGWLYVFVDTLSNGTLNWYGSNTGLSGDWTFIGNF